MLAELGDSILDDIPNEFVINAKIVVHQAIPHACDLPPLDHRMVRPKVSGDLLRSLAYDFQTSYKRPLKHGIGEELVGSDGARFPDQELRLIENVAKVVTRLEGHPSLPPEFEVQ
jgi:hypothetical protein